MLRVYTDFACVLYQSFFVICSLLIRLLFQSCSSSLKYLLMTKAFFLEKLCQGHIFQHPFWKGKKFINGKVKYSRVSNKRTYVREGILTNFPLCMGLLDSLYDTLRGRIFLGKYKSRKIMKVSFYLPIIIFIVMIKLVLKWLLWVGIAIVGNG